MRTRRVAGPVAGRAAGRAAGCVTAALVALVVPAGALAPGAAAQQGTGSRELVPGGTVVQGSGVPAGAPLLGPGTWTDTLAVDEVTHYALELPAGVTPWVAATLAVPRGDHRAGSFEGVGLRLHTGEGECASEYGSLEDQARAPDPATTVLTVPAIGSGRGRSSYGCDEPGRFDLEVTRQGSRSEVAEVPVELLVLLEPPVQDAAALPPAVPDAAGLPAPAPRDERIAVRGSGSFRDAPLLQPGTSTDAVRVGETVLYRVRVGWGQRLAVTAVLSPSVRGEKRPGSLVTGRLRLHGTARQVLPLAGERRRTEHAETFYAHGGEDLQLAGSTPPLVWRNREAAGPARAASLGGDQWVSVQVRPSSRDDLGAVPVSLTVQLEGDERGVPAYATPTSAAEQGPGVLRRLAWAGVGVLAAVGAGLLLSLRRRS